MSNLERIPGGDVSLTLGNDVIPVAESVRVLGVIITPDLRLDKHVTAVSANFFQLLQLRRVRRSLDDASVATLMHAFVTSRVDYCNCLLAGATKALLDKLQRIMNAAARVVSESDTHKFDRGLTSIRRNDLHWLDVPERVTFRLHRPTRHGTAIPAGTVPADPQHRRTPSTALSDSR